MMRKYSSGVLAKTTVSFFVATSMLTSIADSHAASSHTNAPIPLARPFASTPKAVAPLKSDAIVTNAIPRTNSVVVNGSLKSGLDALYSKQAASAISIRNNMPRNSLDRHILTWAIGVSGVPGIPSSEIFNAAQELHDWPGMTAMRRNSERALARCQEIALIAIS